MTPTARIPKKKGLFSNNPGPPSEVAKKISRWREGNQEPSLLPPLPLALPRGGGRVERKGLTRGRAMWHKFFGLRSLFFPLTRKEVNIHV
jgi:hypothetical protein